MTHERKDCAKERCGTNNDRKRRETHSGSARPAERWQYQEPYRIRRKNQR
jgi:hypothetical protein